MTKEKNPASRSEMILHAPLFTVIRKLSVPLIISNLILTFYNLADGLYVARLSAEDFAATGFIWPVLYLFVAVGFGIYIAGTSILAQLLGARRFDKLKNYANHLILICLVMGVVFAVIGMLISPFVLSWMGAEGSFFEKANVYLKINFIGLTFDFIFFGYKAILNAQGNTKVPTVISIVSSVVNILLDPLLIFPSITVMGVTLRGLNTGIAGAAYATIIAKAVAMIMGIAFVKWRPGEIDSGFDVFHYDSRITKGIFRVAIPTAVGQSGTAFGFMILNGYVQSYGTDTLAAYSMVNRITDLLTQPAMGFGGALTAIVGQNFGAGQIKRAKEAFNKTALIVSIISVIGSALLFWFKQPLLDIFIGSKTTAQLTKYAVEYMNYSTVIVLFMGLYSVQQGFFQGSGYTKYAMYMSLLRLWVIRIPLILALKQFTDLGATGIWMAMLVSNAGVVLAAQYVYHRAKWQSDWQA